MALNLYFHLAASVDLECYCSREFAADIVWKRWKNDQYLTFDIHAPVVGASISALRCYIKVIDHMFWSRLYIYNGLDSILIFSVHPYGYIPYLYPYICTILLPKLRGAKTSVSVTIRKYGVLRSRPFKWNRYLQAWTFLGNTICMRADVRTFCTVVEVSWAPRLVLVPGILTKLPPGHVFGRPTRKACACSFWSDLNWLTDFCRNNATITYGFLRTLGIRILWRLAAGK